MLVNLSVKDLALIKEVDIDFGEGLNIITGETGAGKSIIIGSINIALGEKVNKDIIRDNAEYGLVELVFRADNKKINQNLKYLDIPFEDNQIIISRKILNGQSICKINGVTVTLSNLRKITADLVDIHGQHDHQSLLNKSKHLEILDEFAGCEIAGIKSELSNQYKKVKQLTQELSGYNLDEEQRIREMSFYEFEIQEIDNAGLKINEDIELEAQYNKLSNSKRILEVLTRLHKSDIDDQISNSLKDLNSITRYDETLKVFYDQLMDMDYVYKDLMREVNNYIEDVSYDEKAIYELENRIDLLNKLKSKYGKSIENILLHKEESEKRLELLKDLDNKKSLVEKQLIQSHSLLKDIAVNLSEIRKNAAVELEEMIKTALKDLNFNDVRFEIEFSKSNDISENGLDNIEFLISTNPGEPVRPLHKIASGGELSRIMLALKTILAQKDNIETLIFDEIDTGISGRTAGKVAERLNYLGRNCQVICITHLAQIAAMADNHYLIEKKVENNMTITDIKKLEINDRIEEISRILGGLQITDTVKNNAAEMIEQAKKLK